MSKFRQGKSQPLYILTPDKTWLKIRDKSAFYKKSTVKELHGLILAQTMALSQTQDARSQRRIKSTIPKLTKALADKTGESRKK